MDKHITEVIEPLRAWLVKLLQERFGKIELLIVSRSSDAHMRVMGRMD